MSDTKEHTKDVSKDVSQCKDKCIPSVIKKKKGSDCCKGFMLVDIMLP